MDKDLEQAEWFLEGFLGDRKTLRRWMIRSLPYHVGRQPEMNLCLPFKSVSGKHAELYVEGDTLRIRDLGSTNGTFVNRKRIQEEMVLRDGDVLHFSECEFRVGRLVAKVADPSSTIYSDLSESNLPKLMAVGVREFKQMLLTRSVLPAFQPILELGTGVRVGYEVLGRGDQEGLAATPNELFHIAAELGLETELSRLFRLRGMEEAKRLVEGTAKIFLNTHPNELDSPKLLASLKALRREESRLPIVLEVHEAAVTDLSRMQELRRQLTDLKIGLAYDDFGAGQARLLELVEAPPDYLKFDASLIQDIHQAASSKQKMVESLVRMGNEIGVCCLAEGIEKEEEQTVCIEMDFKLGQGFLYGKPAPLSTWLED
ncbi:EAL domain-containing protein [Acidobacteria bacterium AH-259-D05]|nr:EAL domain-containing protein [Acidobacteria bacterium AH-259-D05]